MRGISADWAWIAAWASAMRPSAKKGRRLPMLRSGAMPAGATSAATEPESLEASLVSTVGPLIRHLLAHARRHPAWKGSLTYQQYNVLRMIDVEGPSPQGEVARRLMVT